MGDLVSFSKGSGYSKGDLKDSGTPIILYGRLYTKYETVISKVDTFVDAKDGSVYSKGGEVIVPGSGETAEDISIASVVEKSGVLLGGDLNVITPSESLDSAFLAISISNGKPHSDMAKMAQGKSVVHLHNSDLAKIDLPYPSYEEQRRISDCFADLDNLITLHQRKFEGRLTFAFGTVSCIYKPVSSCSGFSGMISHMPCAVRHAVTARQAASIRSSGLHPNSFALPHIPKRGFRGRYFCIIFSFHKIRYIFFWSIRQNLLIWQMQAPGDSQVSCSCTGMAA